jgi:ribonuclease BN (tRNA processing enzyme)
MRRITAESMEILVLGASGSEGPGLNPTAFLVDGFMLLDAGTVSPSLDRAAQAKITHIFLTHAHLDHIKGIPFLVDNLVTSNQRGCHSVTVLSGREVISDLRRNIFNDRIWPDFTLIPDAASPAMRYAEISTRKHVEINGYSIYATKVNHSVPAYGYLIQDPSGHSALYTGDTGPTDRIWKRMRGHNVKAVIIEVSFPNEMVELALASGHLTPSLVQEEIGKFPSRPEHIYITHLKPYFRKTIIEQLGSITGCDITVLDGGMSITV